MTSYLLTWNPNKWSWSSLENDLEKLSEEGIFQKRWSCGGTKRIKAGDEVFLMRLGKMPKGIMGRGFVTRGVFSAEHWNPQRAAAGEAANYVKVNFNWLVDFNSADFISLDELQNHPYMSRQNWTPQSSGINIKHQVPPHLNKRIDGVSVADVLNKLTRADILDGIRRFDEGAMHSFGPSTDYDLLFDGMRYPPKAVVGLAASNIAGRVLQPREFSGGKTSGCHRTLDRNGFKLVKKPDFEEIRQSIKDAETFTEGKRSTRLQTYYERDARAKRKCLEHFGYICQVCEIDFLDQYGEIGRILHVHHIVPIASVGQSYEVDPTKDLVPVCPNCHAMLHKSKPDPYTVEHLRAILL